MAFQRQATCSLGTPTNKRLPITPISVSDFAYATALPRLGKKPRQLVRYRPRMHAIPLDHHVLYSVISRTILDKLRIK